MTEEQIVELLESAGIIVRGHFVYSSGRHGPVYINKDALFPLPEITSQITHEMAEMIYESGLKPEVIVAPAMGAISIGQWTAWQLNRRGRLVKPVYAEKDGDKFVIKRGFSQLVEGSRVVVVEDILTTGTSAKKTIAAACEVGGEVVGVAALCNRSGGEVAAGTLEVNQLLSLCNLDLESFPAESCPLCQEGVPINTDLGHGEEFLKKRSSDQ